MQMDEYFTIKDCSEGIYKEKGSKFLSFAYPVCDTEKIKEIIAQKQKEFFDARHCCYAWQLGLDSGNYRANDDGEPSGTAGRPIHGQIQSHKLTNILIVVVRYFGGIKLGTSGLINAYKTAAADAIQNAEIVKKTVNDYYNIGFSYDAMNDVMKLLKDENLKIIEQQFELHCNMKFSVRQSEAKRIVEKLESITSVKVYYEYSA